MKQAAALIWPCIAFAMMFGTAGTTQAQQLEPRAYAPSPVGVNLFGLGYLYSYGGADLAPGAPVTNVYARVNSGLSYYSRTFDLLGRQASVTVSTAYAWYAIHCDVYEVAQSVRRSGFFDPSMRFAVNLMGGPALKPLEFFRRKPETTLGTSLTIIAPFGQYDPSRLINLGTNRWSFKPEVGLSQPVGNWVFEVYAGVWLFTDNDNYFGGHVRRQDPMEAYQGARRIQFSSAYVGVLRLHLLRRRVDDDRWPASERQAGKQPNRADACGPGDVVPVAETGVVEGLLTVNLFLV